MKVFIAGGSGLVGAPVGEWLRTRGHEVVVGTRHHGVDVFTGNGLEEALFGVDVVVDLLNTRDLGDPAEEFFRESTKQLLATEVTRGVRHHVLLSIVGATRSLAHGYTRGKKAQEDLVLAGRVPFSIVRATQFREHLPVMASQLTADGVVHAPRTLVQPVALADVVELLARTAVSEPTGSAVEIAGPERFRLDELLRTVVPQPVRTVEGAVLADELDSIVPHGEYVTGSR